jgi:hypothetical protein
VKQAVVALMALQSCVACLGLLARHLEIKAESAWIQLTACETPVLKVDPELGKPRH